ncbi:LysR family transcriptional regulator [Marinospirillum alkaliphilum]|uniref:DNA-binding transcriptional regulator, LysR family n=1 Tax=Marinospirillum alkaliphilum DSM 21637 TaxID=1122209 RepID=A0A1K1YUW9_9GAMM|nr:LysR family transcriptional regulator [Marinospirillum alkaliphilum]SFX65243.1 DNA-binding transcriptional regulator, LysR family [Marinospirillum alkaliphilum DSM 21637]
MKDITNLALFAQVIEHGSFSQAARVLGIPKSTLSRRIADLEEEQGVRLLHRTTRKLMLTDIGKEFLVHCRALLAAAQAAEQVTQMVQERPRGRVRVSCPYAVSQHMLIKHIPDFMAQYPEVVVDLMVTNKPVNLLDDQVDIALRVRANLEDSSLIVRPLAPSLQALVAHPDYVAAQGEPHHPSDLVTWASLSMPYSSGRYVYELTSPQGERVTLSHQPRLLSDDLWLLREAAACKQGLAMLPQDLCRSYLADGRLVQVLPDWQLPVNHLHLVYQHRRGLLPAVRVLIDWLVERLPNTATF